MRGYEINKDDYLKRLARIEGATAAADSSAVGYLGPVRLALVGALMNLASPSPWERYLWAPITLVLCGLPGSAAGTKQCDGVF